MLTTWAVGEAWEIFTRERVEVVKKSFRVLGLALPIDGTCDHEISNKGLDSTYLQEGIKEWERRESVPPEIDFDDDPVELAEVDDDEEGVYYEELY